MGVAAEVAAMGPGEVVTATATTEAATVTTEAATATTEVATVMAAASLARPPMDPPAAPITGSSLRDCRPPRPGKT